MAGDRQTVLVTLGQQACCCGAKKNGVARQAMLVAMQTIPVAMQSMPVAMQTMLVANRCYGNLWLLV